MEMRELGRTHLRVSALGLGGAEIGGDPQLGRARLESLLVGSEFEAASGLLNTALDEGLNVIDTGECYGVSEEVIGKALASRREEFYLFTKTGHASGIDLPDWDPRLIATQIDRSLARLKTDRVDVLQLHSCGLEVLRQGDVIAALQKVRDAGKARFIGYSGDGQAAEYAITCGVFDTLQTSLNIFDQHAIDAILPLARQHNIGVICKRPIGNALWRYAARPEDSFNHRYWDRMQVLAYDFLRDSDAAASIALRFTLSQEGVHTAIVGTRNPEHRRKNAAALSAGRLDESQMQAIRDRWMAVKASLP